ncbi:MAG: hypothetical protein HKP58_06720 [Desulfatitalea sp.]|nr:hypothetical protein [Desulfatitalea sp.]NNK00091.1 hypothetical protein [Desulfatitalea sp.]
MDTPRDEIPKITQANTKKEMLDAYNKLAKQIQVQAKAELKPEKVKEERQAMETAKAAETIASDSARKLLGDLKLSIDKELSELALKMETQIGRYKQLKAAIDLKDKEFQEIIEIERNAHTLAALLESQKQKRLAFETEMAERKAELEAEMRQTRTLWEHEKQQVQDALKEQKQIEDKNRKREKEEYEYTFNREKALEKAKLNDELETLAKEIQKKQTAFDQQVADTETRLAQRERDVADREQHVDGLEAKVAAFPKELEAQVAQTVKTAVDAVKSESVKNEQLLKKGFEGEKNVLQTRIDALEQTVEAQKQQIVTLSQQLEKAYEKVQDIAVKAVSRAASASSSGSHRNAPSVQGDNG